MGERELCGANAVFRWNSADTRKSSRLVDGLPCAYRGVCAHGRGAPVLVEIPFPRDSAVLFSTGRKRMCNIPTPALAGTGRAPADCLPSRLFRPRPASWRFRKVSECRWSSGGGRPPRSVRLQREDARIDHLGTDHLGLPLDRGAPRCRPGARATPHRRQRR